MRGETDAAKIEAFMTALAQHVRGAGRIYLVGGGTAVLHGWRETTIDLDLKADPEPRGFFEAIAELKDEIDLNVELASPDDFLPPLPGWRDRSIFIKRQRQLDFYHFDLYSQALAKIERGHARDLADVREMFRRELIQAGQLRELFAAIEPELIRYPAVEPAALREAMAAAPPKKTRPNHMIDSEKLAAFPGAEIVLPGLRDAAAGQVTIGACLVSIARPLLERTGLTDSFAPISYVEEPERTLYRLLRAEGGNAYGRYNSLLRRLVSFERALRRATTSRGDT